MPKAVNTIIFNEVNAHSIDWKHHLKSVIILQCHFLPSQEPHGTFCCCPCNKTPVMKI